MEGAVLSDDIQALTLTIEELNRRMAEAEATIRAAKEIMEENRLMVQKANARISDLDVKYQVHDRHFRDLLETTKERHDKFEQSFDDLIKTVNRIDVTVRAGEEVKQEQQRVMSRTTKLAAAVITGGATIAVWVMSNWDKFKKFVG